MTACGAVIDTTLSVNEDGGGVRTITATVDASDLEQYVSGGAESVVTVINANLPSGMSFDGLTAGPAGESVFTFSIPFADPEEYEKKIISILGAGGVVDLEASAQIVVTDSVFRSGTSVEENFTSQNLLAWLSNALIANGTVPADQKSNLSEIGTTSVKTGEVAFKTNAQISYSDMTDFGVTAVTITTTGLSSGTYDRTIEYELPREAYAHDEAGYDKFFADITPDDGELTPASGTGTTWTLTLPELTADEVIEYTNAALGSTSTDFAVTSEPDASTPGTILTTVIDAVDCSAICADDAQVSTRVAVPAGWTGTTQTFDSDASTKTWATDNAGGATTFRHGVAFQSVDADATITRDGTSTLDLKFSLLAADASAVGDSIKTALQPTSTYGTIDVTEDGDVVNYTVALGAASPTELATAIADYLPGSSMVVAERESDAFSDAYMVDYSLMLPSSMLSGGVVDGITYTLTTPGHSVESSSTLPTGAQVAGSTVTYETPDGASVQMLVLTKGIQWVAVIVTGVIVLVLAVAVILLIWWLRRRRKNAPRPAGETYVLQPVTPQPGPNDGGASPALTPFPAPNATAPTLPIPPAGSTAPTIPLPPVAPGAAGGASWAASAHSQVPGPEPVPGWPVGLGDASAAPPAWPAASSPAAVWPAAASTPPAEAPAWPSAADVAPAATSSDATPAAASSPDAASAPIDPITDETGNETR